MSFYGCKFSFNGIPCEEYGLMMFDFGSPREVSGSSTASGSAVEDRIARRYRVINYGKIQDRPLELQFVFGANNGRIDSERFFDRWSVEAIFAWLTGHDTYKWLEVEQPDMETVRYKCRVTECSFNTVGKFPWAFECKAICDSPYGYTFPESHKYSIIGSQGVKIFNRGTHNGFYYPQMQLSLAGASSVNIVNHSDNDRLFSLTNIPNGQTIIIDIDNENGVIKNNRNVNLYQGFNFNFFRFVKGDNNLTITGNCNLDIITMFPVNIGG